LEIDGGAASQEMNDGYELVSLPAPHNCTDDAVQGPAHDADARADGICGLGNDRQARVDQLLDLPQVAGDLGLVGNLEHVYKVIGMESSQAVMLVSQEEKISWKQRNHRPDFSAAWRVAFMRDLREIMGNSQRSKLARSGLFLAGLGVQAPPATQSIGARGAVDPKVWRIHIRFGWQNRHLF
jgi:hypothetical protein